MRVVARLVGTALAVGALLVVFALPALAQTDGDSYVGPEPPEVAPEQAEVAPEVAEVAASVPVSGGLPVTGGDIAGLAAIGATAVVVGGVLVRTRRRTV